MNPYQTPQSSLIAAPITVESRLPHGGWRFFAIILLLLTALSVLSTLVYFTPEVSVREIVAEAVVYPIVALGVYGYAFQKAFFFKGLWGVMLWLCIAQDILSLPELLNGEPEFQEHFYVYAAIVLAVIVPLSIFQYIALYRYSQSSHLWASR